MSQPPRPSRRSLLALFAILLLTAAVSLTWSHFKLMNQDEIFVLQTDSAQGIRQLLNIQLHSPISLDPLLYHLLAHAAAQVFSVGTFALRLPSLLGYLGMQVCLFFFVRRIAGSAAGLVAAAVPALTATLYYSAEARPYGVLLGLAGLILLSWQHGTRDAVGERTVWLVTLAAAVALALNTHYFAVLLLIPLCGAELFRIARMHRVDWPVAAAIVIGMAGELLTLPFQHAAAAFRTHYYNAGHIGLHAISQAYRALFLNYTDYSLRTQHLLMAALVVLALALVADVTRRLRSDEIVLPQAELVFLLLLTALPFFGFLMGRFVTHSIEVRYVLCAILGIAVFLALAALPLLRTPRSTRILGAVLLLSIAIGGVKRVAEERVKRDERMAGLVLSPEFKTRLLATPDAHLYLQSVGAYDEYGHYEPDADVRSRIVLVYSEKEEVQRLHHDTASLTAEHMQQFLPMPIMRYEDLRRQPGEHLLVVYPRDGWNWLGEALQRDALAQKPLGTALHGEVVAVEFRQNHGPL